MPESALGIPDQELAPIRRLVLGGPLLLERLSDALEVVAPCMRWQDMAEDVLAKGWEDPAWAREAVETVWRLCAVRSRFELAADEFVAELGKSLTEFDASCWTDADKQNWNVSKEALKRLLGSQTAFSVSVKALELLTEQPLWLRASRIVTDMRPVFDDSASQLNGMALVHTLVLRCQEANTARDLHVALDDADIDALRDQLERARRKSKLLRSACASASLVFIPVAKEYSQGDDSHGSSHSEPQ